jgi:hypothetical protein
MTRAGSTVGVLSIVQGEDVDDPTRLVYSEEDSKSPDSISPSLRAVSLQSLDVRSRMRIRPELRIDEPGQLDLDERSLSRIEVLDVPLKFVRLEDAIITQRTVLA